MRRITMLFVIAASAGLLGACVVAPVPGYGYGYADPGVGAPAGVVYVGPTYPAPAVGFIWRHHVRHGWGWHHHRRGWHRGWR